MSVDGNQSVAAAADLSADGQQADIWRKRFWQVFWGLLAVKVWLAATFPITGDEAFFYWWGVYPDWGYYDHPPMVGWLLTLLHAISDHPLVLRSATVALWGVISIGLVDLLKRQLPASAHGQAWATGVVFQLLPFTWALNVVTTDTPLIFFMFCSGYAFVRSLNSPRWLAWSVISGVALGLGLLSKFFAGLLAIGYFAACVRTRRGWAQLFVIAFSALPFFGLNMAYNATHCWNNIMFNLVNRHEGAQTSSRTVLVYVGMMLYLITPWALWRFHRAWKDGHARWSLYCLFGVPFALFLLLSVKKTIGLHWVLGFMPFVFLAYGLMVPVETLRRHAVFNGVLSVPHLMLLALIIVPSSDFWRGKALHAEVVFHKDTPAIVAALRSNLPEGARLAATAYTPAVMLGFHAGEYIPVLGIGKFHARQDDVEVDFREYAGKTIRVFDKRPPDPAQYAAWFETMQTGSFEVSGIRYHYLDGTGFRYEVFRDTVLQTIFDRYYQIPTVLPRCGCPFAERYGFALTPSRWEK